MIKGIIALFTSGLILNPMVLSGIILGIFCMSQLSAEQTQALFTDRYFYGAVALICLAYTIFFKKTYKDDSMSIDYGAMALSFIVSIFRFIFSCGLTISFIVMLFSF